MNKATKTALCLLIAATAWSGIGQKPASAAAPVSIVLDGYPLPFPAAPKVVQGTTLVPFRAISEALGISVQWNASAKQITAVKTDKDSTKKVVLTVGSRSATVDGTKTALTVAPQMSGGSVLIPLSFFSQQFGAGVNWDQATHTVTILSPQEKMYTLAFYAISSFSESSLIPSFDAAAFGWSRIDDQGRFTTTGQDFKWPQAAGDVTPESLVSSAAAAGTTPYLMVFSGDTKLELTKATQDPELQASLIQQMVDTAKTNGFQGILLDLEGLGLTGDAAAVQASYNAFIQKAAAATHAQGLKLSIALPPLNGSFHGYDYKKLGTLADELIVMAYAYTDEKNPQPNDKVDAAIQLALKQVPASKLVLGVNLASENENTVNTKIGLAKRYNLKGIALWRLGFNKTNVWAKIGQSVDLNN
ncbi:MULTISPECIES: stalk domain-containing protein [unclassified Paenibacillus]|uniref:stalk domain-containing protein n=1 Tax=unclassified Paenibacillus TaxID=185978 RepID=UPI0011A45A29|nr:stalk domain-containing protein [Paenibacillus sp. Y412MC10]